MTSTSIPPTQRVWRVVGRGEPAKALVLDQNAPVPTKIPPGEVLVKIQAAALNPVWYKLMGFLPNSFFKRIAESDLAGEVIDPNGTEFKVGDQVFGYIDVKHSFKTRQGSLATYAFVPATNIVERPSNISPVEAAGLTLAGLTAYQGLWEVAQLETGQTVFINGGSTSVGANAIQMAKARGCRVIASASARNEQFVRDLGADEFIDYTSAPLHEQLAANPPSPKFHAIYETVGLDDPSLYIKSDAYLAPNGIFVSTGPQPHGFTSALRVLWHFFLRPRWAGGTKRQFKVVALKPSKVDLIDLKDLVAEGKVKPVVDSVYEFDDALKAYEKLLTGRAKGKVVVKISE